MFVDTLEQISYTPLGFDNPSWGPVAVPLFHPGTLEKVASACFTPQKLIDYMANLRPRSDGRYLLLNALGAGEYWGVNKNGDYFPEWSLKGEPPPPLIADYIREKSLPIPSLWGYKTFEQLAYPFRHHNNQDPVHAIGDRVCCAAYNDRMHRVELVIFILESKAPDLVKKIDEGVPIPWSMGAKLLWDTCSICLNPARNRSMYCDHLKSQLNQVYPDGRKVFAYNYFPRFFDISSVFSPADKSAYSLRKVAEYMENGEAEMHWAPGAPCVSIGPGMEKFAGMLDFLSTGGSKEADIKKEIPAQEPSKNLGSEPISPDIWTKIFDMATQDQACSQAIPADVLKGPGTSPIPAILEALTALGIVLKPGELNSLSGGRPDVIPEKLDFGRPDHTILNRLKPFVGGRSLVEPHFKVRIIRIMGKSPSKPAKAIDLVKKGEAYEKYKRMLRNGVELEKLAEVMRHPAVTMVLDSSAIEKEILHYDDPAIPFSHRIAPFIAVVGQDE